MFETNYQNARKRQTEPTSVRETDRAYGRNFAINEREKWTKNKLTTGNIMAYLKCTYCEKILFGGDNPYVQIKHPTKPGALIHACSTNPICMSRCADEIRNHEQNEKHSRRVLVLEKRVEHLEEILRTVAENLEEFLHNK